MLVKAGDFVYVERYFKTSTRHGKPPSVGEMSGWVVKSGKDSDGEFYLICPGKVGQTWVVERGFRTIRLKSCLSQLETISDDNPPQWLVDEIEKAKKRG